jgi:hypothetical protein
MLAATVDERGMMYAIETSSGRLHILAPAGSWFCSSCGVFLPRNPVGTMCHLCGVAVKDRDMSADDYTAWFDLDLNEFGRVFGPMAVDRHLNLFIVVDGCRLLTLSFSRKHMWGEKTD